jgi:hypothetical protein
VITTQLPAYPFQQYASDENIPAFFDAYNQLSQQQLNQFNGLNLPNYRIQAGALLDWVGLGLYGEPHQSLPVYTVRPLGPLNTFQINTLPYNAYETITSGEFLPVSDEDYIRIIQWNNFKGDGYQFTVRWLKRRVWRFLTPFGFLYPEQTYDISVTFTNSTTVVITVPLANYPTAPILQAAIGARVVLLPFQYNFSLVLT